MYYYFSSNFNAVIKINGVYLGSLGKSVKTFSNCENDKVPFVEISSLSFPSKTYAFLLNEEFLTSSSNHISITDLKGGYFIKLLLPISDEFSVINQQKFAGLTATVFNENGLKLSIETENDFYYENLDFPFNSTNIFPAKIFGFAFLGVEFLGEKKTLGLYHIGDKIEKKFFSEINEYTIENGFSTKHQLLDIAKHYVEIDWQYKNLEFIEGQKKVSLNPTFCLDNLPLDILPYAFLEELLVGGDIKEYLTEDMFSKREKLKNYLGNYIGVCPPPEFRNSQEVGIIYEKNKNLFEVDYCTFEFENKKICNIKRSAT